MRPDPADRSHEPARFAAVPSPSAAMTLERVEASLAGHEAVVAVIELGSTATAPRPWSDIDLLVVLRTGPDLAVEFHTIDDRPADVLFSSVAAVEGGGRADLQRWLAGGRIAWCRSPVVEAAVQAARSSSAEAGDDDRYYRWVELNVNLVKLRRYAEAADADYRLALDLLLDAALAAAPRDALVLAGRAWSGERDAVRWLTSHRPGMLDLIGEGRAGPPAARLAVYERLAATIAEPAGGLWPPGETTGGWALDRRDDSRWARLLAGA